jgi:hypothetical protein
MQIKEIQNREEIFQTLNILAQIYVAASVSAKCSCVGLIGTP